MTDLVIAIILLAIVSVVALLIVFLAIGGLLAILGAVLEWIADKVTKLWRNI